MTIQVGEVGKTVYVMTYLDISDNTSLSIKFSAPLGGTSFTRSSPYVVAPAVDSADLPPEPENGFNGGVLPANMYAIYLTQATDFDVAGSWRVCIEYNRGAAIKWFGDSFTLVIEPMCDAVTQTQSCC